jgi:3-oxoacyl-[acyl-carrier-protein] synthase I
MRIGCNIARPCASSTAGAAPNDDCADDGAGVDADGSGDADAEHAAKNKTAAARTTQSYHAPGAAHASSPGMGFPADAPFGSTAERAPSRRASEREVVITGAGMLCHLGDDVAATCARLRAGRGEPFERWHPPIEYQSRGQLIGLYRGALVELDKRHKRLMGRAARLAHHAALAALTQSGIEPRGLAVVAGAGTGDVDTILDVHDTLTRSHSTRRISPTAVPRMMASNVSASLSAAFGTTGPSFSIAAACAGGAIHIAMAAQLIASGHVDAALAGGAEAADVLFHAGFEAAHAYLQGDDDPARASRPFAADRAGFVFGEGAGMLVLETREAARARGAAILGVVRGFGMSSNGTGDMVAPSVDGTLAAMQRALRHAELAAADIDYVNVHATSTPSGDVAEVAALRQLFDGRRVPYSSTKGYTGHCISAAGAIEAILTCEMLRGGWLAPSLNAEPLDAALADYPPVLAPRSGRFRHALSNSLGFGGTNACLVLSAPE